MRKDFFEEIKKRKGFFLVKDFSKWILYLVIAAMVAAIAVTVLPVGHPLRSTLIGICNFLFIFVTCCPCAGNFCPRA